MQYDSRLAGLPAITGGLLWALVPLLDDVFPVYEMVLPIIPLLLLVGVHAFSLQNIYERPLLGKSERLPLSIGFALLFIAALVYTYGLISQASVVLLYLAGAPAILGVILVATGSAFTAYALWKQEQLPTWIALLFGLSLPLDPLFNGLITPLLSAGLSLYGISWVVLGVYLSMNGGLEPEEEEPTVVYNFD
jgi:hypothetical protein